MLLLNPGPVTLERARAPQPAATGPVPSRERVLRSAGGGRAAAAGGVRPGSRPQWTAVLMTGSGTAAVESMMAARGAGEGPGAGRRKRRVWGAHAQMCAQYRIASRAHRRLLDGGAGSARHRRAADAAARRRFTHRGGRASRDHHRAAEGSRRAGPTVPRARRADAAGWRQQLWRRGHRFADGRLAAVAATANKCLHGVPGVSFVIVRRSALRAGRQSYLLPGPRPAGAAAGSAQHAVHTGGACLLRACVEALREFAEQGGRAARVAALCGAGGAGAYGLAATRD